MKLVYLRALGIAAVLVGCGDNRSRPLDAHGDSAASDASRRSDASAVDAAAVDAEAHDAHQAIDASHAVDARSVDARSIDASRMPDARMIDARSIDATQVVDARSIDAPRLIDALAIDAARAPDAGTTTTDAGSPGVVSCYTEGNPAQSCTLPTHCCFSNYSSQHDGFCSANACIYGTISCDGPEDCGGGQHCCSRALFDAGGDLTGYSMACQASACGAAPANYELCHIGGQACSNGRQCVTAYLNDNDLPRTLDICR